MAGGVAGGVVGIVGVVVSGMVAGGAGGIGGALSTPIGANGLFLPSLPSGVSVMLESCKELKTLPLKIVSSSCMFLTERSRLKKLLASIESPFGITVISEDTVEEVL